MSRTTVMFWTSTHYWACAHATAFQQICAAASIEMHAIFMYYKGNFTRQEFCPCNHRTLVLDKYKIATGSMYMYVNNTGQKQESRIFHFCCI